MKITVLMENTTPSNRLCAKHGLSLFVETKTHKILFDMGPDASFLDNAAKLGADVSAVDFAALSHGHFDHAGGLQAFLDCTADREKPPAVFANKRAFLPHAAKTPAGLKDIGADPALAADKRITLVTEDIADIAPSITLLSNVKPEHLFSASNAVLLEENDGEYAPDSFAHEQSMLIREEGKAVLISGCSHTGIVNIIARAEAVAGRELDAVIGGFHLMNPSSGTVEDEDLTRGVASFMAERSTRYFTFHCTGLAAYSRLRDVLGPQIEYLGCGASVTV